MACISDLIVKEGLINLDFADVLAVMREKGKAMMGRGEASGEKRVLNAAMTAMSNPLIENPSIKRASGLIISITGGKDLSLFEVDEAVSRIREEADPDANIIVGASSMRVWKVSSASRWWRPASIIPIRRPRRNQRKAYSQNSPAGCATAAVDRRPHRANAPLPHLERPPALAAARHPEGRPANPDSEYARHAAPHGLDPYGRPSPARNLVDESILDIPTFLRRKAS